MPEHAALLYTDLVDSTRLGDQLGEVAMLQLWQAHDRTARDLVRAWEGLEIGRSDGFLLMFPTAAQALGFAIAYHGALVDLHPALKTRVGLHVGPARLRLNSATDTALGATRYEMDGSALPVVARVMSAALAGQTLLTAPALQALGDQAGPVTSHGHWRLKGVDEPVELFEAHHPGAPLAPPPDSAKVQCVVRQGDGWLPRRHIAHNLPAERDAFVGRGDMLQALASQFESGARLVTLVGTGGTGKTRAALRFGRTWLGNFTGGIAFCDLSQARSVDGIVRAVALGLDLPLGAQDPVEQLARALAGRSEALVILDNFEQVAALAPQTLGRWLDRAAGVRFLVTTRAVLGLPGEAVLQLQPLPADDAGALFVLRAEAAAPNFRCSAADQPTIDALVRLLDGLPLAIELAAARVRLLPPQALLQRMSDRFRLLAVGSGRSSRQATLRGTLDWSWELLTSAEKSTLAQLSVFEGGFTLACAEAVLVLPAAANAWSLDLVQSLVDKSLVRSGRAGRLDLLQSVQQYAAEHLATADRFEGSGPQARAAVLARHARHFASFDDAAAAAEGGVELDNLVAACRRAVAVGDAECAVGALAAAWAALRLTGPVGTAIELVDLIASLPALQPPQQSIAEGVAGSALNVLGRTDEASERLHAAITAAHDANLPHWEARWLCALAEVDMGCGRLDAAAHSLEGALALADVAESATLKQAVLNGLGSLAMERGQLAAARGHYEAALEIARSANDRRWLGGLLSNLGAISLGEGRLDEAQQQFTQALQWVSSVGDKRWQGYANCNLALLLHEQGRHEQALEQFESALHLARALGYAQLESTVLCNLGLVHEALGNLAQAREHMDAAVHAAQALHDHRSEGLFRGYQGRVYARLGLLTEAQASLDEGERLLRDGSDNLSLGLLLSCKARVALAAGDLELACTALNLAQDLMNLSGVGGSSELGREIRLVRALQRIGEPVSLLGGTLSCRPE